MKLAAEQAARDVARIMLRAVGLRRAVKVATAARAERDAAQALRDGGIGRSE